MKGDFNIFWKTQLYKDIKQFVVVLEVVYTVSWPDGLLFLKYTL